MKPTAKVSTRLISECLASDGRTIRVETDLSLLIGRDVPSYAFSDRIKAHHQMAMNEFEIYENAIRGILTP